MPSAAGRLLPNSVARCFATAAKVSNSPKVCFVADEAFEKRSLDKMAARSALSAELTLEIKVGKAGRVTSVLGAYERGEVFLAEAVKAAWRLHLGGLFGKAASTCVCTFLTSRH